MFGDEYGRPMWTGPYTDGQSSTRLPGPIPPAIPPAPIFNPPWTQPVPDTATANKLPPIAYKILRLQWRRDGYDDAGLSDSDIDRLVEDYQGDPDAHPLAIGALGDGSLLKWLRAHKELLQVLFELGKLILPLLL